MLDKTLFKCTFRDATPELHTADCSDKLYTQVQALPATSRVILHYSGGWRGAQGERCGERFAFIVAAITFGR